MTSDSDELLRKLGLEASNKVETLTPSDEFGNDPRVRMGGSGGGQSIPPTFGGGGMTPWEDSVEKRLDSLDRRLTGVENNVSQIRVDTGVLRADVSHLPSKGFTITVTLAALTALSLITAIIANLDKILGH